MSEEISKSLMNVGDLAKPITAFIERIAEFFGGVFAPTQMKRLARAEVEVAKIQAAGKIDVSEIEERGLRRLVRDEGKAQANIEAIAEQAVRYLLPEAEPQKLRDDWISFFFERCKLISDPDMQELWARILSGEANSYGVYSRNTLHVLSMMDKQDAELFSVLCSFCWKTPEGSLLPVIFDSTDDIYITAGLNFVKLNHLESLGLIINTNIGYGYGQAKGATLSYFDQTITARLDPSPQYPQFDEKSLPVGKVIFTSSGFALSQVCRPTAVQDVIAYTVAKWAEKRWIVDSQTATE